MAGISRTLSSKNKRLQFITKNEKAIKNIAKYEEPKPEEKETHLQVIYEIPLSCGATYVGQTKRGIKIRLKEHKDSIRKQSEISTIAQHIKQYNCCIKEEKVKILDVEKNDFKRKIKEALYIYKNQNCISKPSLIIEEVQNLFSTIKKTGKNLATTIE